MLKLERYSDNGLFSISAFVFDKLTSSCFSWHEVLLMTIFLQIRFVVSSGNDSVDDKGCGGAGGTRTPYLLNAIQALSQMSYSPSI